MLPGVDRKTVDVYEQRAARVDCEAAAPGAAERGTPSRLGSPAGVRADLGCGPGWYSGLLGEPVVALDAAFAMVARVHEYAPAALPVQADLERLPFRPESLVGGLGAQVVHAHPRGEGSDGARRNCTGQRRSARRCTSA